MNKTLRLSLLYLLLIIPQHGNSPIPRMESWMEMDQGDGFVDRDLTSSLTGAESFGSAHKNYQNALIRKKQSGSEDGSSSEGVIDEFSDGTYDRIERRAPVPQNYMQYPNFGYSKYAVAGGQNQAAYELPERHVNSYEDEKFKMELMNKNGKASNLKYDNTFRGQRYSDVMSGSRFLPVQRSSRNSVDESGKMKIGRGSERVAKCAICGSRRSYDPEEAMMELVKLHNNCNNGEGLDEHDYSTGYGEPLRRVNSEFDDQDDLQDVPVSEGQGQRFLRYGRYDEDNPNVEESEYYGEDTNPALVREDIPEDLEVDYSQVNPSSIIYKREEKKGQGSNTKLAEKGEEISGSSISEDSKLKSSKEPRNEAMLEAMAPKESHEISKTDTKALSENAELMWKMNSDLQSKELKDVMRDSQRALEEVQVFQQKLASKPQYAYANDWKMNGYLGNKKRNLEEDRRNKREDEDEQKNMKTGTDEGGGEYEDEEGKGHNDEEEYYEEAEFSGGKTRAEDGQADKHLNEKFYKREAGKDEHRKAMKGKKEKVDMSSEDYELNLENAPVENEDKSKKSSLREGAAGKKHVARKGVKIWDEWGQWSPCSVTCGVGRMTRWRHCIGGGCAQGEKEAQIKKCTNPAC